MAHRKGRSALTGLGIALGVAIFFGVGVANSTVARSIDALSADFVGRADVRVNARGALDATLEARVADDAAALPGVADTSPLLGVPVSVHQGDEPARSLIVIGNILDRAQRVQELRLAEGRFAEPGEPEVVLPPTVAEELGAEVGGELDTFASTTGSAALRVVGVLEPVGAGRTADGLVAFTSLETAWELDGRGFVLSAVDVALDDGVEPAPWIDEHADAFGPAAQVMPTGDLTREFRDAAALLGSFFTFFAAIALFVGAFLIYLTLSAAVIERTRTYGTMRAIGMTRGQMASVVVREAAILGLVCTLIGLLFGGAIALGLVALLESAFEEEMRGLAVTASTLGVAVAIGLVVTLISALVPAIRASRLQPVESIRGDYREQMGLGRAWIAGAALVVAGVAALTLGFGSVVPELLGTVMLLAGTVLVSPVLLRPLARVLGVVTDRIAGSIGRVAVLHLVKERSRSAYTLALIMVVMAMMLSIGGVAASIRAAAVELIDRQFGADLQVETNGPLPEDVEQALRTMPGVARATPIGYANAAIATEGRPDVPMFVVLIEPETYFEVSGAPWLDGDDASASAALASGPALLMPGPLVDDLGAARGDTVQVRTRDGLRPFEIAGTMASLDSSPIAVMSLQDGRRYLGAGRPSGLWLDAAPGADVGALRDRIGTQIGTRHDLDIQSAADMKRDIFAEIDQIFSVFNAIVLVAGVIGLLGLANTLAMSVMQRYREIGVLRAIGVTRSQTWRLVLVESGTLALVALTLAVPLGMLLAAVAVSSTATAFGFTIPLKLPVSWVPAVVAFGAIVAVVAALAPGRRAARMNVVGALQYE